MHCVSANNTNTNDNNKDAMHCVSANDTNTNDNNKDAMHCVSTNDNNKDAMHCVSTIDTNTNKPQNQFGPQSKNLASIVRGFKSSVTVAARKINPDFQWQSRFHDHIIRNEESFQKITNYIICNPANWQDDKFYKAEP